MTEIYWLQAIGNLSCVFCAMWIFGMIAIGVGLVLFPIIWDFVKEYDLVSQFRKVCKTVIAVLVIGVVGSIFIPSTEEMYAIYGLGGTIDYIKSNDKAKQLPDKCVEALTRYVDSIEKENKDNNN